MVFSELAAATLIAVCGLKNSYRIILRGERFVRRGIRQPAPVIEGYQTFPRYFIRRIFRAGLGIAMRWEGRAKNAAQVAADARLRARQATTVVVKRAEDVRNVAQDRAHAVREKAEQAKKQAVAAKESMVRLKDSVRQRISRASDTTHKSSPNTPNSSAHRKFSSSPSSRGLTDALPDTNLTCNTHHQQPAVHSRL